MKTIPNKLSARAIARIQDAWINGANGLDLAVEYNVSVPAIHYHTRGLVRLARPRLGQPPKFDHQRAFNLRQQGLSYSLIAERFGVTRARIHQVVKMLEREAA